MHVSCLRQTSVPIPSSAMEAYAGRLGVHPTFGVFFDSKLTPPIRGLHQAESLKGSRVPGDLKGRQSFDTKPLTFIILLCHKYLVNDHNADLGSNDSHARKLKKHCRRLMAVPIRLLSPIPNPIMELDHQELSARRCVRNSYLGKVTPSAISLWQLCPRTSKTHASRRQRCQHTGD